ncbi:MAG: hypothetical protein EXS55_00475 [Candidatus Magasanikbacteria bacterium]|nr:hypothetical protein [Candidatus Magasanikbacteria bacterium]
MELKQISHKIASLLKTLVAIGLGLIGVGGGLFLTADDSSSWARLYLLPALPAVLGFCFLIPSGIILLKIWLVKSKIKNLKETGEKVVKVAAFADKTYTKYANKK